MMDCPASRERELIVDLESGEVVREEDRGLDLVSESRQFDDFRCRPLIFDQSVNSQGVDVVGIRNLELSVDKNSGGEEGPFHVVTVDRKGVEEKHKKKNSTKASKPPRPPKNLLLDAADQKLMQEIAQLAMRKRARIERIRALKKMRAAKASSWNNSLIAMVITVIFCVILIFQGICNRNNNSMTPEGSPEPAVAGGDLISVQLHKNLSTYESSRPGPDSLQLAEDRVSSSAARRK